MAIKIKNNFIEENIEDLDGNVLGKIKFNPNDTKIMNRLTKIVNDLTKKLKEVKNLGEMPNISEKDLKKIEDLEDFEKLSKDFEKMNTGFELEEQAFDDIFNSLAEIFGVETLNIFTGGTKDISSLLPLIEYITPHIKKAREKNVSKYLVKETEPEVLE